MYNPRSIASKHVASRFQSLTLTCKLGCVPSTLSNLEVRRLSSRPISSISLFSNVTHEHAHVLQCRGRSNDLAWLLEPGGCRSLSTGKRLPVSDALRSRTYVCSGQVAERSNVLSQRNNIQKKDNSITISKSENELDPHQVLSHGHYDQEEAAKTWTAEHHFQTDFLEVFVEHDAVHGNAHAWQSRRYPATRLKADLSYHAVRKREAAALADGLIVTPRAILSTFRDSAGIRQMLWLYMRHLEPLLKRPTKEYTEDETLDKWLSKIFSEEAMHHLRRGGYGVEDVASWSWILSAETVSLGIRRYIHLAANLRNACQISMPLFIPLQLLRAEFIDSRSLTLFIEELEAGLKEGPRWDKESGAILLIRLLRHARLNNAEFYEGIAELAPRILSFQIKDISDDEGQRSVHFYNRFLSLLALPLPSKPFLSVPAQQRAQLRIARFMTESQPQILLNREGYRALARLQLMHAKTDEEQRWSSVKAPSWPPWRRDELGIDARVEYSGRQSRVAKVIKRLLEAGYGPESVEREAQILAGWDTDKSPTIQVRRISPRRPLSWIKSIFTQNDLRQADVDHHAWAARVAATRSIREAWVCFYSYMEATTNQRRQLGVYHEMFHKLFARAQQTDQRLVPSPGDGKEVYPDPMSPRDWVYVPKEPPTIAELYGQMLQDGIAPAGRLLANLIDSGHTLKTSLDYIRDSTLSEVKKDVLLHPEKYPRYFIRNVFSTLPDYLLASFVGSLTKHHKSSEVELFWPAAKSVEERGVLPSARVKPLYYGMALMQIWKPRYMPAYHAILEGVCTQAMARRSNNTSSLVRQYSYHELWITTRQLLDLLTENAIAPDLVCFRKLVILARNHTIRAPNQFVGESSSIREVVWTIKSVFVRAVNGSAQGNRLPFYSKHDSVKAQPYWRDIEALILNLGFVGDFEAIIDMLKWLQEQGHHLDCVDEGSYKMQRITCAARAALEAIWAEGRLKGASKPQIDKAKEHMERWGWPEKADMDEFLEQHAVWFEGMRAAIKHS